MGINSSSGHHLSLSPFTCGVTPLFLRTDPSNFNSIYEMSQSFQSLVKYVSRRKHIDPKTIEQACALLHSLMPSSSSIISVDQILFNLVPPLDGSCLGFTKSVTSLLTSSNEELVHTTLSFLLQIVTFASTTSRFTFLESGLFALLPTSFYKQEMHILAKPNLPLIKLVEWVISNHFKTFTTISEEQRFLHDCIHLVFVHKLFRPVEPFLEFICNNRHRIRDPCDFATLFGTIIESSPCLEHMTLFVLSSPVALAYNDSLEFFEQASIKTSLLLKVLVIFRHSDLDDPAFWKRAQRIRAKLIDEGLSDGLELLFRFSGFEFHHRRDIFLGRRLIHILGGNLPLLVERRV
ncbi:hypothetical protein BLNAU_14260 [Blattamonas nauphoetae]|uniref:Uncharacterized protein n=1 Tax=Blattamonas nauphoetae TaxID=2049346 RepID=A0ABQ9XEE6_9EUKA|nr:hypothetical protein BLNAU_14260 [Blattamonas nauphoetae]